MQKNKGEQDQFLHELSHDVLQQLESHHSKSQTIVELELQGHQKRAASLGVDSHRQSQSSFIKQIWWHLERRRL